MYLIQSYVSWRIAQFSKTASYTLCAACTFVEARYGRRRVVNFVKLEEVNLHEVNMLLDLEKVNMLDVLGIEWRWRGDVAGTPWLRGISDNVHILIGGAQVGARESGCHRRRWHVRLQRHVAPIVTPVSPHCSQPTCNKVHHRYDALDCRVVREAG